MTTSQIFVPALPLHAGVTFRHIPGFVGYCVGDDGTIWSCKVRVGRGNGKGRGSKWIIGKTWRRKIPVHNGKGYLQINRRRHASNKGARNGAAKLNSDDVCTIRSLGSAGLSQQKIAAKFGVHQTLIGQVLSRKRWSHVETNGF